MNKHLAIALLFWEDHDDEKYFEAVTEEDIVDQSRWNTHYEQVWKDRRDGSLWEFSWSRGSTEQQDFIEDAKDSVTFREVKEVQKVITAYVGIDE